MLRGVPPRGRGMTPKEPPMKPSHRFAAAVLVAACASPAVATPYAQTNLVSDVAGLAQVIDPSLRNPWGMSFSATSPFWVSDQGTNTSTLYRVTNGVDRAGRARRLDADYRHRCARSDRPGVQQHERLHRRRRRRQLHLRESQRHDLRLERVGRHDRAGQGVDRRARVYTGLAITNGIGAAAAVRGERRAAARSTCSTATFNNDQRGRRLREQRSAARRPRAVQRADDRRRASTSPTRRPGAPRRSPRRRGRAPWRSSTRTATCCRR